MDQATLSQRQDGQPRSYLGEWIDGNSIQTIKGTPADHEIGFVESLYQACLATFQGVWKDVSHSSAVLNHTERHLLREGLSRFLLWGEDFDHGYLDQTLEHADDLRKSILRLLGDLGRLLLSGRLIFQSTRK